MATQHTYGWADLDEQNRKHYGRGKPAEIFDAEIALEDAEREEDKACDLYCDFHYGDPVYEARMRHARAAADRAAANLKMIRAKYGIIDAHLESQYDERTESEDF